MSEIDSLEIKIESEAGGAISNLKTLEKQLERIAGKLNAIGNSKGFKELSRAAREAAKGLSGIQSNTRGISIGIGSQTRRAFKSLEELQEQFKDLGKGFQFQGSSEAMQKQIDKYFNALQRAKLKREDLETSGKTNGKAYENAVKDVIKYENVLESLNRQLEEVRRTENSMGGSGNTDGWKRLSKATESISKAFGVMKAGGKGALNAVKKLGSGFSHLYSVIAKISSAIGNLFRNMTRLATKATNVVVGSIKGISNAFSRLKSDSNGLQSMSLGFKNLAKAAGGFLAANGIVDFGKSAIELGSNITEVENVVDTAFGSMADKAYDFAKNAASQFGLSELAAKQYSGTMMAMLKSSGVAQGAAADMSISLAGLAGDLASFYNLDTDVAFQKLRAGISGETEPLKQLGINMNIVNLEAYAMSHGITKAYQEMTLAEQTTLRYNYILDKTKFAQGDFAKTSGSFANQLRLLRLNLQSISAIIGQGLIAAILPAIKALNKLMEKLTQAAKKFRDFMYVLFGKKIESPMRGVVDDMAGMTDYTTDLSGISNSAEDVESGMEDAADGTDNFTSSAKKLQKQLATLSFDELNQLPSKLDDLGDLGLSNKKGNNKGKDLGLDDLGLGNTDSMFDDLYDKAEIEPINKWAEAIRKAFLNHDWEGLGKAVAEMLNAGLEKIYKAIKHITPKVEQALKNLAQVINGFIKYFKWDLLGRTIGAGVNLLTRSFNALFDPQWGIKLEELGKGLSKSFRGMIDEIEWITLGNALGNAFMIPWRIASGFVEDMWRTGEETFLTGWAELGNALAEGAYGIVEKINLAQIGKTLADGFNGIIEVIRNFRNKMYELNVWGELSKKIRDGLNELFKVDLKGMAEQASGLVLDILHMLNAAVEPVDFADFGYRIAEAIFTIPWKQLFDNVFYFVAATFGEAMKGFTNYLTTHAEQLGASFASMFNGLFDKVKYITDNIPWPDIATGISTFLNTSIANIRPVEAAQSLGKFVTDLLGTMLQVAQETNWNELGQKIGDFLINIPWSEMIGQAFGIITNVFGGLITGLGGKILEKMPEIGTALAGGFNHAFETLKSFVDSMDGRWTEIGSTIATSLNNMITGIDWKTAGETFGRFIKGIIDTIFTVAKETDWVAFGRGIGDFLDGIPWLEILGKVAATIGIAIKETIDGLKQTASGQLITKLGELWLVVKGFQLGNKVLGIVNEVAKNFGLLPQGVESVIPALTGKVAKVAGDGTGSSGLFAKIATSAGGMVSKIGPILGSIGSVIFSPQGLMIAGIVAGVAVIIANWDSIKKAAGEIWGAIKTAVTDVWEGMKTAASDIWGGVKNVFSDTWEGIKTTTHDTWDGLKTYFSDIWGGIKTLASDVWGGIKTGIGDVWDGIKTVAGDVWGSITGKVSDANSEAESNTATTWGNTKENLNGNLSAMASSVTSVMSSINSVVSSSMAQISNTFLTGWQAIAGATGGVLRQTQSEVMMLMQSIKALIATSMQEIGSIFANGWRSVTAMSAVAIEQINATVTAKMMAMKSAIITLMQQIAGAFSSSWTAIGSMSIASTTRMLTDVNAKMTNMVHVVNTSMKAIGNAYTAGWKSSESATSSALSRMQSIVSSKMNAVQSTVLSKMNAVKNNVSSTMNSIQSTFQAKWTAIGNVVNQSLGKIQSTVTSKMNSIKSTVNTEMANIHNAFKGKWDSISNTCTQALNKMQSIVSSKMSVIKSTVSNSMSDIVSSYQNGMNKLPNITSNALTRAANELNKLPNKIGQSLNNNMLTAGKNAAISFANGIKSVYIPTPHIRVASWTQHRAGDSTYSTPNFGVNWYKSGGLAYKPSVVGIGEAGKEGILPLENKKTMGMIADSILDNYSGGAINEDMLANAVAEGVAMALMNNIDNLSGNSPKYIQNSISLDGDVLIRAVTKAQDDYDYRVNPTPQFG